MFEGVLAKLLSKICGLVLILEKEVKIKKIKFWKINGYDSLTKIYEKELKLGYFSEEQIQAVLQSLVAKAGLDFDEIVGAYARRKTRIANDLLLVQKDGPSPRFICGGNPYFTARLIEK